MTIAMPKHIVEFQTHGFELSEVLVKDDPDENPRILYPWASHFIGRFPIPVFQRELCWTTKQDIELIESIYLGFDIGTYMVNDWDIKSGERSCVPLSDVLIDGQQRINAICRYVNNEFQVFGANYKDIDPVDQRRFKRTQFPRKVIKCFDEEKLRTVYNKLNFSGVRHREDQRA